MATTYVYEGQEYVLTGRSAVRKLRSSKELVVNEIRPIAAPKNDNSYNKWVEISELYVVSGEMIDD